MMQENRTMTQGRTLALKHGFHSAAQLLPEKIRQQVYDRVFSLQEHAEPDGDVRKKLKGYQGNVYRIRSGDYRILYCYDERTVTVLLVDNRKDVYDHPVPEAHADLPEVPDPVLVDPVVVPDFVGQQAREPEPLPRPITEALLGELKIAPEVWPKLLPLKTVDDLLNLPGVNPVELDRLLNAMCPPTLGQALGQRDLVAGTRDDLLLLREGKLISFLLRLTPEQEHFVTWGAKKSVTLLKGGPGTGKSTVALYRVRHLIEQLEKKGQASLRVLFTTYTNALVRASREQLVTLLGEERAAQVEVRTADSVLTEIVESAQHKLPLLDESEARSLLQELPPGLELEGTKLKQAAQRATLEKLGPAYLFDEINKVIDGRGLTGRVDYLAASRAGRGVQLGAVQRTAVWALYEAFGAALARKHRTTWSRMHAEAARLVEQGKGPERYDVVVIDEVQDLDPAAFSALVGLGKPEGTIFLTADANQSIYGSSFRWQDVHDRLKITGHTGHLRSNQRSTREIGEAAQSYLQEGALEEAETERKYVHSGVVPVARRVADFAAELELVSRFLRGASRYHRLGLGACAVLCPTEKAGRRLAKALEDQEIPATFMSGKKLELRAPGVKVITLVSSKGLEFPIVALAGFLDGEYPHLPPGLPAEEEPLLRARERRTMFVAMTRAMRALLVALPPGEQEPLFQGFSAAHWNLASPAGVEA
jgi:superfamily I DNA/RNA helicase/mRNA-degrading endonuclease RelE of RelBE toxin-antitoxin system